MFKHLIKANHECETKKTELLLKNQNVIYALSSTSRVDFQALKLLIKQNKFTPLETKDDKSPIKKNYFQIRNPKRKFPWQTPKRMHSKELGVLAENRNFSKKAIILPVDIFWGKSPERQDNWLKLLFRESWEGTSFIRNLFKLFFNGRNVKIFFHKPLEVEDIFSSSESDKNLVLKTERLLRARFRQNRKAHLGPDISNRRTLVTSILNSKSIKAYIEDESEGNPRKIASLRKKASKYIWEICSDMSYPVIYLYDRALTWFWNSRYENLEVLGFEKIRKIAPSTSLIFSPCHRSHIDYLALSYLLYYKDLMLPQIVAGKNLDLPLVGSLLRKGGAFFMRRSFSGNRLYSVVFYEHLRKLMQRGHSIEFFPEGGRSRSGKLMPSRPGIISMILRSFLEMDEKQVSFVPIAINYEKVLEGNSYIKEVMGADKKKESLKDIFSVFKDFRNYLGEAYLQFADPISLNDFIKKYPISDYGSEKDWLFKVTPILGKKIMTNINDATVVTSTALFSMALLNSDGFSISKQELISRIELLKSLMLEESYSPKILITKKTGEEVIEQMKKLGFISKEDISDRISLSNLEAAKLSFYRNNISHLLIFESLICGFFQYQKEIIKEDLFVSIKMIYPFLKEEFFLKWDETELDKLISQKLKKLQEKELIIDAVKSIKRPDFKSKEYYETQALGKLVQPSIDRFYVLISQLWKNSDEHISKNTLEKNSLEILKNLEKTHARLTPEFSEKWMFDIFLNRLIENKYVREDDFGMLYPTRITQRLEKDAAKFLEPSWLKELSKSLV